MSDRHTRSLEIHGHRGARGLAPENTIAGFQRALAIGVDALELDVGMSADGVVMVHHDPALNPNTTRDASGNWLPADLRTPLQNLPQSDLMLLNVGRLRPGTAYARRFSRQEPEPDARIPTLSQVARLLHQPGAQHLRLNVETKTEATEPDLTPDPEAFASAVVKVLRDEGVADRANIQSFDWSVLTHVQRIAPETPTGYLSAQRPRENTVESRNGVASPWTDGLRLEDFGNSVPDMVHAAGGQIWVPHHQDLSQERLGHARALGLRVLVWTVNSPRDIRRLIRMGVDGIISDYPDRVRSAAETMNLAIPPQAMIAR